MSTFSGKNCLIFDRNLSERFGCQEKWELRGTAGQVATLDLVQGCVLVLS
jgi:hypothetical protein